MAIKILGPEMCNCICTFKSYHMSIIGDSKIDWRIDYGNGKPIKCKGHDGIVILTELN